MDTETLRKIQRAILDGLSLKESGLAGDAEIEEAYWEMKRQIAEAPAGSMLQIIDEPTWGQWDALSEATERAHGPMFGDKTLNQMYEERRAEVARLRREKETKNSPPE